MVQWNEEDSRLLGRRGCRRFSRVPAESLSPGITFVFGRAGLAPAKRIVAKINGSRIGTLTKPMFRPDGAVEHQSELVGSHG